MDVESAFVWLATLARALFICLRRPIAAGCFVAASLAVVNADTVRGNQDGVGSAHVSDATSGAGSTAPLRPSGSAKLSIPQLEIKPALQTQKRAGDAKVVRGPDRDAHAK